MSRRHCGAGIPPAGAGAIPEGERQTEEWHHGPMGPTVLFSLTGPYENRVFDGPAIKKKHRSCAAMPFPQFAEKPGFEPGIPFWGIHAFQACLLSHSSISPEWDCKCKHFLRERQIFF